MSENNRSKSENTMTIIKQHEKRMRDQDQVEKVIFVIVAVLVVIGLLV